MFFLKFWSCWHVSCGTVSLISYVFILNYKIKFLTIELRISPVCKLVKFQLQQRSRLSGYYHLICGYLSNEFIDTVRFNKYFSTTFHSSLTLNIYIYVLKWDKILLFSTPTFFCHFKYEQRIEIYNRLWKTLKPLVLIEGKHCRNVLWLPFTKCEFFVSIRNSSLPST